MIKVIIFDNNGVLVTSNEESAFGAISRATGLNVSVVAPVYDRLSKKIDIGEITTLEFFDTIVRELKLKIDPRNLEKIAYESYNRKEDSIKWVKELSEKYEVALLTNFGDAYWRCNERWQISELFPREYMIISSEIGIIKPDPEIYQYTLKKLKVEPKEAVFIDDKESNTKGAEAVGMHTILFHSVEQAKKQLKCIIEKENG
jgi:epoxide hydrolase-like predicted phosphatase